VKRNSLLGGRSCGCGGRGGVALGGQGGAVFGGRRVGGGGGVLFGGGRGGGGVLGEEAIN
jgi:hypothetical protein